MFIVHFNFLLTLSRATFSTGRICSCDREAKTKIDQQRDWLAKKFVVKKWEKLQLFTPNFLNKFAEWKLGFRLQKYGHLPKICMSNLSNRFTEGNVNSSAHGTISACRLHDIISMIYADTLVVTSRTDTFLQARRNTDQTRLDDLLINKQIN